VEWVEVTGRTVEEAKDAALDQLGVDESEAEFEVLAEPRAGLFGRLRVEARVRARVQPTAVRPKVERGGRRRGRKEREGSDEPSARDDREAGDANGRDGPQAAGASAPEVVASEPARSTNGRAQPAAAAAAVPAHRPERRPKSTVEEAERVYEADEPAGDPGELGEEFLRGLVSAFGVEGTIARHELDDGDTIELAVEGQDLGMLIGPRGQTLAALQELTRTVVQRKAGDNHPRLVVDVGGYRKERRQALERFTRDVAAQVIASGMERVLEPMPPADRKVVHDTANSIDGVSTASEGEDPRRRVVILPDQGR
jgi:spoIIIJ-associated protein